MAVQLDATVVPPWQHVSGMRDPDYYREMNRLMREQATHTRMVLLPLPALPARDPRLNTTAKQIVTDNFMQQLRELTHDLPTSLAVLSEI